MKASCWLASPLLPDVCAGRRTRPLPLEHDGQKTSWRHAIIDRPGCARLLQHVCRHSRLCRQLGVVPCPCPALVLLVVCPGPCLLLTNGLVCHFNHQTACDSIPGSLIIRHLQHHNVAGCS
ncbi:hypothetical protein EJ04DRAFT_286713 [Polyplosphaeria fusca]|uniref:Uncharacterized protein n=1 Tax=Polyplosphaeria fusca TaxID=682080 RepID=A0A9P4R5V6_9PLEO|nr:hypothetical protein EJ04DRAFT_286713 [Polyplosphaeria fusca]